MTLSVDHESIVTSPAGGLPWTHRQGMPPPNADAPARRRWSIVLVVAGLYAVGLLLWQVLRFTPLATWWLFEVADIFGFGAFAVLPPLLLMSMLCGSRAAGLCLLVPLCLFSWEYTPPALFRHTPTEGRPLKIMTANLLVSNEQRTPVGALMLLEQPDIVALQELGPEMASHLEEQLKDAYPYRLMAPSGAPDGFGMLSRYPIRPEMMAGWDPHGCGCQRVTIDLGGRTLAFINVHPPPPEVGYRRVARLPIPTRFDASNTNAVLAAALDGVDLHYSPLIVAGDFNVSDRQARYRALRTELLDAHRAAGWGPGYTFPARGVQGSPELAMIRIDYVLHDRSVVARRAYTGAIPGSDHRYVVAELLLP